MSDELEGELERLVGFEVLEGGGEDTSPIRRRVVDRRGYCGHRHFVIDEDARTTKCDDCGAEVDAFTALAALCHELERWASHRDRLKADAKRAAAELEDVKRELRNAKARRRRASS